MALAMWHLFKKKKIQPFINHVTFFSRKYCNNLQWRKKKFGTLKSSSNHTPLLSNKSPFSYYTMKTLRNFLMYTPLGADMGRYYDLFAICCALADVWVFANKMDDVTIVWPCSLLSNELTQANRDPRIMMCLQTWATTELFVLLLEEA